MGIFAYIAVRKNITDEAYAVIISEHICAEWFSVQRAGGHRSENIIWILRLGLWG